MKARCPRHGIPDCSPLLNGCSWTPEVTHAMFDQQTGIMPCCGLSRYEVVQSDRVSIEPAGTDVTCDGKKRFRKEAVRR
jgi:hypothetical protein